MAIISRAKVGTFTSGQMVLHRRLEWELEYQMIKYWPEYVVFAGFFALLSTIIAPAMSWMMVNSDVGANILAAKYFYSAHGTGEPLYTLLNHLFMALPFGVSDSWRSGLLSTLSTIGGMVFIYLTVKLSLNRWYALLASIIYGSAMLVVSQSGIVQLYTFIAMISLGAYYFSVKKQWKLTAIMIGLGLATAHLILIVWFVLIGMHKEMRNWKMVGLALTGLVFYLYIPISRYFVGSPDNWGNQGVLEFVKSNVNTALLLIGNLPVWDFPKRLLDTIGIIGASLWFAMIPVGWWIAKLRTWKNELLLLFVLPILYYATDLAMDTAKYMVMSIGFGAIMAVYAISAHKKALGTGVVVCVTALSMFAFNLVYFNMRNLDPQMSAQKFYDEELPKIPDGEIFMTNSAWAWQSTLLYNKAENRNIIPISIITLESKPYVDKLEVQGIKLERNDSKNWNTHQALIAKSILDLNPNVWMDVVTDSRTYGAKVIKGDNGEIAALLANKLDAHLWKWKPSNPYDMVTGAIQITEWKFVTVSNWNMLLVISLTLAGLGLNYFLFVKPERERKKYEEVSKA